MTIEHGTTWFFSISQIELRKFLLIFYFDQFLGLRSYRFQLADKNFNYATMNSLP